MNAKESYQNTEAVAAALPASTLLQSLQLAQKGRQHIIPAALPAAPPRPPVSEQKLLAARRSIELAFWQASGGDFLRGSFAPWFLGAANKPFANR